MYVASVEALVNSRDTNAILHCSFTKWFPFIRGQITWLAYDALQNTFFTFTLRHDQALKQVDCSFVAS